MLPALDWRVSISLLNGVHVSLIPMPAHPWLLYYDWKKLLHLEISSSSIIYQTLHICLPFQSFQSGSMFCHHDAPQGFTHAVSLSWVGSNVLPVNQRADMIFLSSKQSTVHRSSSFPESKIKQYHLIWGVFILPSLLFLTLHCISADFSNLDQENWKPFLTLNVCTPLECSWM